MSTSGNILKAFSYTEEEQRTFVYIKEYMSAVDSSIPAILDSEERRKNFMLAGLYLTYRACNHTGQSISTIDGAVNLPDVHLLRLRMFKEYAGCDIRSTREYLSMIGLTRLRFLLRSPASTLIRLVLK